jgi:copper(I)-binding protein
VAAAVAVLVVGAGAWLVVGRGADGTPRITAGPAYVGATGVDAAAGYVRLENSGSADDRLVRVSSPTVPGVTMHTTRTEDGMSTMESADSLDVPAGGSLVLTPGRSHLMLEGATTPLAAGSTVRLHLEFAHAPAIDVDAAVVPLAELPDKVGAP